MTKRRKKAIEKKTIARKKKIIARKSAARKAKAARPYDVHTGQPTGREVQAMQRLQTLTDRFIAEGLTPADAYTRAREVLRANPREDWRAG
jgi:hypothetical protein